MKRDFIKTKQEERRTPLAHLPSLPHMLEFAESSPRRRACVKPWLRRTSIAPLVFSTLVVGVAAVGHVGGKALGWFMLASLLSLTPGLLVQWLEP